MSRLVWLREYREVHVGEIMSIDGEVGSLWSDWVNFGEFGRRNLGLTSALCDRLEHLTIIC